MLTVIASAEEPVLMFKLLKRSSHSELGFSSLILIFLRLHLLNVELIFYDALYSIIVYKNNVAATIQDSNYGEERNKLEELLAEITRLSQSRLPEPRNRASEIQVARASGKERGSQMYK
jgi:hypothetical protein